MHLEGPGRVLGDPEEGAACHPRLPPRPVAREADPRPAQPTPKDPPEGAAAARDFPGFRAATGAERNELGYPDALVHEKSGIELVAVGFQPRTKPTLYAARRMVTEREWDGEGADRAKVSISGRTIATELKTRLPGLSLPTESDWQRLVGARDARIEDTADGGLREWLAPASWSSSSWPIRKDPSATSARNNESSPYRGFRVVFRPQ